jgi:protein NirF
MRLGRRAFLSGLVGGPAAATAIPLRARTEEPLRGTGDLGVIVERASGSVLIVETTGRSQLARVEGLGDLSHASVTFSRDERYAFVFGRDGGLTKLDLLTATIAKRTMQAGNSIGGAISQDGALIAVANYEPGGVRIFDARTLSPVADIPAAFAEGRRSKVVGLVDAAGQRFVFSLWDAGQIWLADLSDAARPRIERFADIGRNPYDGLVTSDGRWYVAGLFGEDGVARLDLWNPGAGVSRVLPAYGARGQKLPVYKMPHLEGWADAGDVLVVPGVGAHEVVLVDRIAWTEAGRIPVHGQPVFAVARPDGREVWVNFAHPHNGTVQVIDVPSRRVTRTFSPGRGILHLEFTPRGEQVWLSARDDDKVLVYDTRTGAELAQLPALKPSGIFLTPRAHRTGF